MDFDEYELLKYIDHLIDTTESLESQLKEANLTLGKATKNTQLFMTHFKELCTTYSLPMDNKAKFCQILYQTMDNIPEQDMLWLYTALFVDAGLLFDTNRIDRTIKQDVGCYLTMHKDMAFLTKELQRKTIYNNTFREIKQQLKIQNSYMEHSASEADVYFILNTFKEYFPADSNNDIKILMDNITLLCNNLANDKELMTVAPLFVYQVVSKHKSRLCSADNFYFDITKLWAYKPYQIETDNGKNFNNLTSLFYFFLDLCDHFSKNPAVDIGFSCYIFSELSNICEWYYTNFEHNKDINLPIPLAAIIDQCQITFYNDDVVIYGCSYEDTETFSRSKQSHNQQIELKIEQHFVMHPEVIQYYIENLSASSEKRRHIIYELFDNANLPTKYISTDTLPIIYSLINVLIDVEVNRQSVKTLLLIGKQLTNSLSINV